MQPCPPFRAPRWLRGGHAQTVAAKLLAQRPPAYRRVRWETPDGDFIDTDWIEARPGAPLLALFHGLEGSSRSHYCTALMHATAERGWNGVVVHFRGCSGELNRLPRAYHSGDDAEIDWILRRLRAGEPPALYAAGVSLGGNALLKWLGMRKAAACSVIDAAASVCAPVDLAVAAGSLERGFGRVYARYFLRTLKPVALAKLRRFPGLYAREAVLAARSLREFDDAVTAPLHGFRDAADYYARASALPWLSGIRVPTLMIHAADDPFLPAGALPRATELPAAVLLECTQHGGHVGFLSGPFPGRHEWLPRRLLDFFSRLPETGPDAVRGHDPAGAGRGFRMA